MDSDEIYKFVGYAVAVLFFIYLISKALSLNVRIIEGATTIKDSSSKDSSSKGNSSKGKGNSSKKNVKDNKYDDVDKNKTEKQNEEDKDTFDNLENRNKKGRRYIVEQKERTKDYLSIVYNSILNKIIGECSNMISEFNIGKVDMPKQETLDNMNKLKTMKDYLDTVEFAYNQLDEFE